MSLTAVILGATGLTGSNLLRLLTADDRFSTIIVFVRRATSIQHPKLEEHVIDFDKPEQWGHLVRGDALFSAFGTTRKKAGSLQDQRKVDFSYQYQFAKIAFQNAVPAYILISSFGADSSSRFPYLKIKGELDRDVQKLGFERIRILRPGPIEGDRQEVRLGEKTGIVTIRLLNKLGLFRQYRPIEAQNLAQAMRNAYFDGPDRVKVLSPKQVFQLAEKQI